MTDVGQMGRRTQQRVVQLFRDTLAYDYLGDWTDRPGNRNIEQDPGLFAPMRTWPAR